MNYLIYPGLRKKHKSLFRYASSGNHAFSNEEKLERVKTAVYYLLDVRWDRITARLRGGVTVKARYIVSAILFDPPFVNKSDIGRLLNKDHTTIIHYLKQHRNRLCFDEEYVRLFEAAKSFI